MLEDYLVIKDVDKLLRFRNIVKDGLNIVDIKILKVLHDFAKPMGSSALAMSAGINQADYERIYEPFLVELGYIKRTPRRQININGVKLLEGLNNDTER